MTEATDFSAGTLNASEPLTKMWLLVISQVQTSPWTQVTSRPFTPACSPPPPPIQTCLSPQSINLSALFSLPFTHPPLAHHNGDLTSWFPTLYSITMMVFAHPQTQRCGAGSHLRPPSAQVWKVMSACNVLHN